MLWWMLFPYIVAGVGVLFYVTHFPEIKVPTGVFDIFGHSHQIWHVFIFSGNYFLMKQKLEAFLWKRISN